MSNTARFLLLASLILGVALSGCIGQADATNVAKSLPEVQEFLAQNPGADIKAVFFDTETSELMIKDIRKYCGEQMQEVPYWYVTMAKGAQKVEIYLDETGKQARCILKTGETRLLPAVECSSDSNCNDNNPCTTDSCNATTKKCRHTAVTQCKNADGCCPSGCTPANDNDCIEADQCAANAECSDNDNSTNDECKGTPKKCSNTKITACRSGDNYCPGNCTSSNDPDCPPRDQCKTNADCNDSKNSTTDICSGTPQKCTHTIKTCVEMAGEICLQTEACAKNFITTKDSNRCCLSACTPKDTCSKTADCNDSNPCTNDMCMGSPKQCEHIPILACQHGDGCCLSKCNYSNDNDCPGPCTGVSCPGNQKCVDSQCVLKTCPEMRGTVCASGKACTVRALEASDAIACCTGICETPNGDLLLSGEPVIAGSGTDESLKADCSTTQMVFLDLNSTFSAEKKGITFDANIDGRQVALKQPIATGESGGLGTTIKHGKNRVHFKIEEALAGHTLTIAIDSNNAVNEINENNNVYVKEFPGTKMDLSVSSAGYDSDLNESYIEISRNPATPDCPPYITHQIADVYIGGEKLASASFLGFNLENGSKSRILLDLSPGEHAIRVVLDPDNFIDESNEGNNEYEGTITVP